jgi:hypothetical protein
MASERERVMKQSSIRTQLGGWQECGSSETFHLWQGLWQEGPKSSLEGSISTSTLSFQQCPSYVTTHSGVNLEFVLQFSALLSEVKCLDSNSPTEITLRLKNIHFLRLGLKKFKTGSNGNDKLPRFITKRNLTKSWIRLELSQVATLRIKQANDPNFKDLKWLRVVSGIRLEADENCALPGYYTASSGNCLADVSGQPIGPILKDQAS